jgi:hypothetical protein
LRFEPGALAPGIRVILTLRSDFLGQTSSHPDLSHAIAAHEVIVPAMNADELRQAIAEPARRAGQPLSAEVVDLLLEQTAGREGALPLLEFALTQVWDGLANGVEPAATLNRIGGVGGALANTAQDLFDRLSEADQQIARRALLAMIRLGEGTTDSRRRVKLAEIVAHQDDPQQVRRVLNHFASPGARLVTLADDGAEITHEALLEHWTLLKSWLDAGREDLRFHRRLADAAQHWAGQDRPAGLLWRRPDLDLLRQYHARNARDMTALQMAFWQESERRDKQTRFWKRTTAAVLVVLTVVSVIGAMWAVRAERIVQQEKRSAEIKEIEALYQTSRILRSSHDELNALVTGVKTGIKTKQVKVTKILKNLVTINLQELVYNIRE